MITHVFVTILGQKVALILTENGIVFASVLQHSISGGTAHSFKKEDLVKKQRSIKPNRGSSAKHLLTETGERLLRCNCFFTKAGAGMGAGSLLIRYNHCEWSFGRFLIYCYM